MSSTSYLRIAVAGAASVLTAGAPARDTWPDYADETAARLVAPASVGAGDAREKDYAWGDVDQDGDIDLVAVRKEPWNTEGRFRNVLFMNEGRADGRAIDGVLVDRTSAYAAAADDAGQGMLDPTNDRDVAVVDVNGDGWLDVVTSTTYGEGLPKTISHPRVYVNLGESAGAWLGFRYEQARTPTMPLTPHFCGVGVGDVSGDGAPDLYFVDYNGDLEDRLWINDGAGFFTDETVARVPFVMRESDFGVHAVIADMNGDGVNDIVKDRGSTNVVPPLRVTIAYNDPDAEGTFDIFQIVYNGDPYHTEVGDLDGDGRLDLVVDDDGIDRYFLNTGNAPDGTAQFATHSFPPASNLFGGNIVIRDIDRDGHMDVAIADVDVDCCGCTRFMKFWRSLGNPATLGYEERTGGVSVAARTGTHDIAIFDLNGDGWDDFIIGTCTGMSIWVAQPSVRFVYPDGLPETAVPNEETSFLVQLVEIGGAEVAPGGAFVVASVAGSAFTEFPMVPLGGDLYTATLPAAACAESIRFSLYAETTDGGSYDDPPDAPSTVYMAISTDGGAVLFEDDMEGDVSEWIVLDHPSLTSGAWERAVPNGTLVGSELAAPDQDATLDPVGTQAFVTQNGPPGGSAAADDVDGGPSYLVSPRLDLSRADATVSVARWMFCDDEGTADGDVLVTDVSNDDGASWLPVPELTTTGTGSAWESVSFVVGDHVAPTATVRVRFGVWDVPNNSVTEAGIDDFTVAQCAASCAGDLDGDGAVGFADLLAVLTAWGPCTGCVEDLTGDDAVGFADLLLLLAAWGDCERS